MYEEKRDARCVVEAQAETRRSEMDTGGTFAKGCLFLGDAPRSTAVLYRVLTWSKEPFVEYHIVQHSTFLP
uniref:Uncharacterized protein n=1 Tax=Vespula pensylvanica TaxID=30213 RepID=A0A834PCH3_VESPE|nr:hypothetical protein H0235_003654 [Vespula pensylvanica]